MPPVIRKQPLLAKIKSAPFDILLWVNETRLLIEWDDYATSLGLPLGITITIIVIILQSILNYYEGINVKSNNSLFSSDYVHYEQLKSTLINGNINLKYSKTSNTYIWILQTIVNLISIGSLVTFYKLFTTFREYGLLYLKNNETGSLFKRSLKAIPLMISKFYNLFTDNHLVEENAYDNDIWILKLWNPSKFSLYLFIAYNPINLGICLISEINLQIIFIILLITLQTYLLIYKFSRLIQDKQILNLELMKEYTNKFVKPLTSKLKKDVQIDSTLGPFRSTVLTNPKGYVFSKLKVFKTHDLEGKEIKEIIQDDDNFQSFEEYTSDKIPNQSQASFSRGRFANANLSYRSQASFRNNLSHSNSYFDEHVSEEDSDSEDWYVSSTPYKNNSEMIPPSRSQSQSPFKSPNMKPKTIFNTNKFTSPNPRILAFNATPLPYRSPSRSPSRSPNRSPVRSPDRSSNRSPVRSPVRSYRSQPSSRDQSPNRTYLKSPSPSKRTEPSRPWR